MIRINKMETKIIAKNAISTVNDALVMWNNVGNMMIATVISTNEIAIVVQRRGVPGRHNENRLRKPV